MKTLGIALGVVAAFFISLVAWFVVSYNGFIGLQENVNGAWAQVQNVYQRRADLVPNLVETVKGAANFEKSTLQAVVEARAGVGQMKIDKSVLNDPGAFKQFEAAQGQLSSALSRLMVVVERYPELKANANFRDLQVQLEGTENRITVERRSFNEAAVAYNTAIKRIPGSIVASFGRFKERPYFEAAPEAQKAPTVKF
jgi:LemA protein